MKKIKKWGNYRKNISKNNKLLFLTVTEEIEISKYPIDEITNETEQPDDYIIYNLY